MTLVRRAATLVFILFTTFAALVLPDDARANSSTIPAFAQAVAEAAARDEDIAAYYRSVGYAPLWTGTTEEFRQRREALLMALSTAADHGLPVPAYGLDALRASLSSVTSQRDLGRLEVEMSRIFLLYARHVQTGILTPKSVDSGIVREVPLRDRTALLAAFADSAPGAFMKALPPPRRNTRG